MAIGAEFSPQMALMDGGCLKETGVITMDSNDK